MLFPNVIKILPTIHENKTKMLGKKQVPGLFIRSGKLCQLYASCLSIIFSRSV